MTLTPYNLTSETFVLKLIYFSQMLWRSIFFQHCQCIFTILLISPPGRKALLFIWTNFNPLHPRMLCAKFGWNWPSGSGEDVENEECLEWTTTDNKQTLLTKAHKSLWLRWAKTHLFQNMDNMQKKFKTRGLLVTKFT